MVIAIDGPAGAGKSTVARAVARELGFTYLDTGAMYRAVGLASTEDDIAPAEAAHRIGIEHGDHVLIDGRDVSEAIRTPEVAQAASRRAADPGVRQVLVAKQQTLLAGGDWVAEGRDIATVVAPGAAVKVHLTASPDERARRRGVPVEELRERDERDTGHGRATLEPAPGAVAVDTTGLTIDEVVARIVELVERAK